MSSPNPRSTGPTTTSPSSGDELSYTQMGPEHDLDSIGKHCQLEFCGQLDFLPFRCESCKGTFCLDHRSETAHKCPRAGEWAAERRKKAIGTTTSSLLSSTAKPTIYNSEQCSQPSCKTLINTLKNAGVHCQNCNRNYCLEHRVREEHDCSKLTPLGARVGKRASGGPAPTGAEKARMAFSRLRNWGKEKSTTVSANLTPKPAKPKPNSPAARAAQFNTLKRNAKGDPKLDAAKRFYLHVEASADTTTAKFPTGDFYFDPAWSVGRVLDDTARKLQVQNVNNRVQGEEEKLRIFHVEGGKLLDFSGKIGSCGVAQGDTIVLLRGVGPPVPDLIEP